MQAALCIRLKGQGWKTALAACCKVGFWGVSCRWLALDVVGQSKGGCRLRLFGVGRAWAATAICEGVSCQSLSVCRLVMKLKIWGLKVAIAL
jgi:hypothetical protein